MSDLPCEITMQILVAPARIIRSSRYSETALGRSVSPSVRLPTGSSSLEKARGWIRLPVPAAGTIPQMLVIRRLLSRRGVPPPRPSSPRPSSPAPSHPPHREKREKGGRSALRLFPPLPGRGVARGRERGPGGEGPPGPPPAPPPA